jgi:hypothetical protein
MTHDEVLAMRLARLRRAALGVGVVCAAACAIEAFSRPASFFPGYLAGWMVWWGVSSGALAIVMIHNLSGGAWGQAIRRTLDAASVLMPLVAVLFVPVFFGLPVLYRWARPEEVEASPLLQHKAPYLSEQAFTLRAIVYFVLWSLLAIVVSRLAASRGLGKLRRERLLTLVSGPGLVIWGLGVTFAAIDWAMSLEPEWVSSSFGVLIAAGQATSALSLAIAVLVWLGDLAPFSRWATADVLSDLGNFLLAFVMFWAYIAFTQFLIIWSGNLPEEATWYLHRAAGGWQWLAGALALFHFAVPFFLLLARATKRRPRRLAAVVALLFAMRIVEWNWLVMPAFYPQRLSISWVQLAATGAVGGFWLAAFGWRLAAASPPEEPAFASEEPAA